MLTQLAQVVIAVLIIINGTRLSREARRVHDFTLQARARMLAEGLARMRATTLGARTI